MQRERLKDRLEEPRDSLLDLLLKATVALVCIGAVGYALIGRQQPDARVTAALQKAVPATGGELTLTVTPHGTFYWNQEGPIPLADFAPRLAGWLRTNPMPDLVIGADASGRLGDVTELLNEARRQGVTNVRLKSRTRSSP